MEPNPPTESNHLVVRLLTDQERNTLTQMLTWDDADPATQRLQQRARVIILSAHGLSSYVIAQLIHMGRNNVIIWIKRFNEYGLQGLEDRPRPGRPRKQGK